MDQLATYHPFSAIAPSAMDTYRFNKQLLAGTALPQIDTQYRILSSLNGPAAFRRSSFPKLTPNPYGQPNNPGMPDGTFIKLLFYPIAEFSVNTANVNAVSTGSRKIEYKRLVE